MTRLLVVTALGLTLLAACHHDSATGGDASASSDDARVFDAAPALSCTPVDGTPTLTTQTVATGLDMPVFVTSPPNDPRLFVLEKRSGKIKIVKDGAVLDPEFLDVPVTSVSTLDDERGLLGLAFPSNYATTGKLYVFYVNADNDEEIDQYNVSSNPDVADATTRQTVIIVDDFASNHNGGTLGFGPDGYLYFAIGDGGNQDDVPNNSQNLDVLFGKVSRIDVSSLPYTIPASNPFAGAVPGADEVWDYGLRNPYRWSFDRQNGDMYIGDVGQDTYEEVDVQSHTSQGGVNFGWHVMEATHCFNPSTNCDQTGKQLPVYEYSHNPDGCAVIGGAVYRGACMPGYDGTYFFADYCNHWVRSFQWDGANGIVNETQHDGLGDGGDVVAIGQDAEGELYIVREDTGEVQRIVPQ